MSRSPRPRRTYRPSASTPVHPDVDLAEVNRLWAAIESSEEPTSSIDEILDRNYYETIASYDQSARLGRRLDLTVSGEKVSAGSLDINIAEDILRAFSQEVDGAATAQGVSEMPKLELAGISRGSAILHLVPTGTEAAPAGDEIPIVADRLDAVLERINRLHDLAEREGDLREFGNSAPLLKGLHELTKALDQHNLQLRLRWRSATGAHRQSSLTDRARAHVRSQWEDQIQSETLNISGLVVAMDLNGTFDVKTSIGRKKRYTIHVESQENLLRLNIMLGEMVHVVISAKTRVNRLGIASPPRYEFVGFAASEPTLQND
ncbi:hypothetical protein ACGFIR_18195 [Micromonospora sp. NPDC049051]|uniref:hypothetical protein n=1 Tax=Micromonospora sp. NPDC049051 TaxID=3364264 RepID=UPI00372078C2